MKKSGGKKRGKWKAFLDDVQHKLMKLKQKVNEKSNNNQNKHSKDFPSN